MEMYLRTFVLLQEKSSLPVSRQVALSFQYVVCNRLEVVHASAHTVFDHVNRLHASCSVPVSACVLVRPRRLSPASTFQINTGSEFVINLLS